MPISGYTGSAMAAVSIKTWLRNCEQHHQCRQFKESRLPTRLVDVRNPGHISLYCTDEVETGIYACLSHCWGTTPTLRTTSETISTYTDSIPWSTLPKVYQHAISVANNLDIPFLWIDSLCIIQDSDEDWIAESAKMADIYSRAVLTIAASLAERDTDSLFSYAPKPYCSKLLSSLNGSKIFVRKTMDHGHGPAPLPLLNRAWVLQERLLSSRIVHFTHQELVWECMEQLTCECGCIRSLWSPGHVPFDKDLLYEPVLVRSSTQDVHERWRRLVHEYSRLHLTHNRDKLPAISGAARRFSGFMRKEYLAGLWGDKLLADLLWERVGNSSAANYIEGIPSWSWMAAGIHVVYDDCISTEDLSILVSAVCNHERENDQFGQIRGGEVTLMANLVALSELPQSHYELIFDDVEVTASPSMLCARMAMRHTVYSSGIDEEIWLVLVPAIFEEPVKYRRVGILKQACSSGSYSFLQSAGADLETIIVI